VRLASWGAELLELLLPPGCAACKSWIPGAREAPLVCGRCRSRLRVASWPRCPRCHYPRGAHRSESPDCLECRAWSPALGAARFAYVLEPPADDLVHALKYEGWSELAGPMGDAVAALEPPSALASPPGGTGATPSSRRTVVVPVPTTAGRLRRRGYNQAELLAHRVAALREAPLLPALVRRGEAPSQTALAPTERRDNVRGAFAPARGAGGVRGADVLLVDDVLTTGATASEAAAALADLEAASVTLLAFARALPTGPRRRP
jgi:predicted amidophosphoribosyltransferase